MFNVGDRVTMVEGIYDVTAGDEAIIVCLAESGMLGIETLYPSFGHSCRGHGKPGHCWWVSKKSIKISEPVYLENK